MSDAISTVSDDQFEAAVVGADMPVIVDFWAEWCAPCHILTPILEEIARDQTGRIKVLKMNVDENPAVPMKYGIRTIPTLILFKGGEVMARISGVRGKDAILKEIQAFVPA